MPSSAQSPASWPFAGQNLSNTRFAAAEATISAANAGQLAPKWVFTAQDDISATPAIDADAGAVYIPDWAGCLYKLNAATGQIIWSHSGADYGLPGHTLIRTSPTLAGGLVIVGASSTLTTGHRVGAYLMALDAQTGNLVWKQKPDPSPFALMTSSPIVYQNVLYVGVSSAEEVEVYPTFQGSIAAYDLSTGNLLWRTKMAPPGYTGVPIWSSTPVVDPKRNSLYITTGNNYTVPKSVEQCELFWGFNGYQIQQCQDPANYFDSIVSLDLNSGAVKWARRVQISDAWKAACNYAGSTCPDPEGPDFDFGSGPNLFTTTIQGTPTDLIGAGQKSGYYWAVNPDTGAVVWCKLIGPGGKLGGIQWGTATDGQQIYIAVSNTAHRPYLLLPSGLPWNGGSWAAISASSGAPIWQVPDPTLDPVDPDQPARDLGPVTVANGVVFAPSMSGTVFALSAATGAVLWHYDTGGSVNAGAAVVNGTVYWGSGYGYFGGSHPIGTHNNKLFAFSVEGQ